MKNTSNFFAPAPPYMLRNGNLRDPGGLAPATTLLLILGGVALILAVVILGFAAPTGNSDTWNWPPFLWAYPTPFITYVVVWARGLLGSAVRKLDPRRRRIVERFKLLPPEDQQELGGIYNFIDELKLCSRAELSALGEDVEKLIHANKQMLEQQRRMQSRVGDLRRTIHIQTEIKNSVVEDMRGLE